MRVFLDTNVWLSATVFSGLCEELLLQCAESDWLYSSPLIRVEAHEVLSVKFSKNVRACDMFDSVWSVAQLIEDVADPADDNDARLVNAACHADMDLFVTGDKRVLSWTERQGKSHAMRIVRSEEHTSELQSPC